MFWSLDHFSGFLNICLASLKGCFPPGFLVRFRQFRGFRLAQLALTINDNRLGTPPHLRLKMKKHHGKNPNSHGLILLFPKRKRVINCHTSPHPRSEWILISDDLPGGAWLSSVPCSSPSLCLSLYLAELCESHHQLELSEVMGVPIHPSH